MDSTGIDTGLGAKEDETHLCNCVGTDSAEGDQGQDQGRCSYVCYYRSANCLGAYFKRAKLY